ncbi:hypothetical protein HYPSUDRAFT_42941 [Hypholoma sublateritium FD-334 SS-4]|uniref:Uncharacterized protein n=1 Tax=Hypholoma sublateritium (strain FD-334 SS-4) TaxID=945553 RepID=A0A0D2NPB2_HYPSF|nr:hypothetical protein HYPSUDRAFT_42941 [Hypholoma sublateritium FD-334 SS-4]
MFRLLTLVTLSLLGTQSLVFADPGPSAVPTTTYFCPGADEAGFSLANTNLASDPIFCSYPAVPGENQDDFFCTYSATNGHLVTDNDAGFCPSSAVTTTSPQRRGHKVARNPLPSRPPVLRGIPAGVSEKAYLKKRRVHTTESA